MTERVEPADDMPVPIEDLLGGIDSDLLDDMFGDPNSHLADADLIDGGAINWRDLSDTDAGEVWEELREWVDWLISRYDMNERTIPNCWYRHGGVVEELSALHTAWKVSFSSTDSGYGPIGWHERLFVCEQRLAKRYEGNCASSGHQDSYARRISDDATEWSDWIGRSHAGQASS